MNDFDALIHAKLANQSWAVEAVVELLLAAIAGGLVGLERELRGRQAGFRTNLLVCVGSALVMIVSIHFASVPWDHQPGINVNVDPARIAYGVMTGIGWYARFPEHYAGDASGANRELGDFDMKAWAAQLAGVIRAVKADQLSLRLQQEFFERARHPLDTRQ